MSTQIKEETTAATVRETSLSRAESAKAERAKLRGPWRDAWRRFRRHKAAMTGSAILLLIIVGCVIGPFFAADSTQTGVASHEEFMAPNLAHPFGTDDLGRDELSRILNGGRISILVGFLSVLVSVSIGTIVGMLAGYFGGFIDTILMRLTDFALSFPRLFLSILLVSIYGNQLWIIVVVIGGLSWMTTARLVRGSFLSIKEREFIEAARVIGVSTPAIMFRHILPNALGPLIVAATLGMAGGIISESSLSFLGLGIQPPAASWGNMLNDSQGTTATAPWLSIFPGLFIFLTVLSINFIGDGLRDALDPRGKL